MRAVADGRVVYADWLRGFGNLLILDHGGGYMSLYGYNDGLLRQVGDGVKGGDAVAQVGRLGGRRGIGFILRVEVRRETVRPAALGGALKLRNEGRAHPAAALS